MSSEATADAVDPAMVDRVRATLVAEGSEPTPAHVAAALRGERRVLGQREVLSVVTVLRSELAGTGVRPTPRRCEPVRRCPTQ
jgi:pilus assembly protein CpaF